MPELPEVETTRRGIANVVINNPIQSTIIRHPRLRWPIPLHLPKKLKGNTIESIDRRGKYLLCHTQTGSLIIHLGMSGCLRIVSATTKPEKHDHVDILFADRQCLRYTDPRRFGAILWTDQDPYQHRLIAPLGVEPLTRSLSGNYLYQHSRQRRALIKPFIMNSHIVVGVGNIYANEALFQAGISPFISADALTRERYQQLVQAIKKILRQAIKAGGTTLKDFYSAQGKPGYFSQQLQVYGRENQPCPRCKKPLKNKMIQQRKTVYCSHCQT